MTQLITNIGIGCFVATMLLLSPVLLPLVALSNARETKWRRETAERTVCARCGQLLGERALQLADEEWHRYVEELRRERPHVRLRLQRDTHAICPGCGQRYLYRTSTRQFVPVIDDAESPLGVRA